MLTLHFFCILLTVIAYGILCQPFPILFQVGIEKSSRGQFLPMNFSNLPCEEWEKTNTVMQLFHTGTNKNVLCILSSYNYYLNKKKYTHKCNLVE